jgi:hypothetical protein
MWEGVGKEYHVQAVFEVAGWIVFAYEWRHGAMVLRRVYEDGAGLKFARDGNGVDCCVYVQIEV